MKANLPPNESQRLESLARYQILDTPKEANFDRITSLARLLKVPIVLVTMVDQDRQWFKSSYGTNEESTVREASFCAHAILSDTPTIVPDLTLDSRFGDNELVTCAPFIRFYAGAPLKSSDGFNLGTLCAVDVRPRDFGTEQIEILSDLAAMVMDELHLRLALRQRDQLAVAIANLSSGMVITDPAQKDNPIIFCNPGFTTMTGYTEAEVIGKNCRFLQGRQQDVEVEEKIRLAVRQQQPFHGLVKNFRKDGSMFWNELSICPVMDKEGKLTNFVGLQTDATERKLAEEQLRESLDRLREAETLRDSLTNMIVHDLRSPLSAILMSIGLLQSEDEKNPAGRNKGILDVAYLSTQNLMEMVSQLLDVSRLEAGEMKLELSDCDILPLVHSVSQSLQSLYECRRVDIVGDKTVPSCCDSSLIQRVIANLLGNALKFTPNGGKVRIEVKEARGGFSLSITDNGLGIAPEFHERIFEKFGQVSGSNRVGSGLGLAFCRLAVEAHGGTLKVKSEVGRGSTFTLHIPQRIRQVCLAKAA